MESNLIALINRVPSKAQIHEMVQEYQDRFLMGEVQEPLREYIGLKAIQAFVEDALKAIQPYALDDADKYERFQLTEGVWGASVQVKSGATKYDYSANAEWREKDAEVAAYKEQAKMAENERKAIEKNMQLAKTAEIVSTGAPVLAVTFK